MMEMLLYIGLSTFVIVALLRSVLQVMEAQEITTADTNTQQAARFVVQRIIRDITNATAVDVGSSVFNTASGTLVLDMPTIAQSPTVYSLVNGMVYVQQGTASSTPVTSSLVRVTQMQFTNLSSADTHMVRVQLTVENATESNRALVQDAVTLTDSAVIRLPQ